MKKLAGLALFLSLSGAMTAQESNLIPQPQQISYGKGEFTLSPKVKIFYQSSVHDQAQYLLELLENSTRYDLELKEGKGKKNSITLSVDPSRVKNPEGYELIVSDDRIEIIGADAGGVFYGVQSLLQFFPAAIYSEKNVANVSWTIPVMEVVDAPAYAWRGMMLDVARYFYDKEFVKKYIDMMAMYKMNKLQFHFIDDSGWRLEIKKYPELTQKGAWAGEGPNRLGGFYTQEDIKEIVAYAQVRNVEVIPEIAFPAHMLSAVVAYPWLSCEGKQHILPNQHFISRDLLCVGKESSFEFLEDVFEETMALFPSKYFNIGGDEAVYEKWAKCPKCQAVMKANGLKKTGDLQGYLTDKVSAFLSKHGKTVMGWEEIVDRGELDHKVVSMVWRSLKYTKNATDKGHYAVLTPATHTYFDFPESRIPGEPKAATWMPPISVERCYSLEPAKYNDSDLVLGVQGCYWSDQFIHGTVLQEIDMLAENRSENYAEYLTFPRLLALAEVGWTKDADRNYEEFADRLKHHYAKLDYKECHYRLPLPEVTEMEEQGEAATFTLEPSVEGSKIVYTTDGSYPHEYSKEYTGPVRVADKHSFKAATLTNKGVSLPYFVVDKMDAFKKYGQLAAQWKPSVVSGKVFAPWKFETTGKFSGNGTYEVTFIYTGGTYKLDIENVKLYKRNELVAEDKHVGAAGGTHKGNVYTLTLDSFEAGTPFFIEADVRGDLGNDTKGYVFIKKIK